MGYVNATLLLYPVSFIAVDKINLDDKYISLKSIGLFNKNNAPSRVLLPNLDRIYRESPYGFAS